MSKKIPQPGEVIVPEHPVPQHIKDLLEAVHGKKINQITVHDVSVEAETPYAPFGDPKNIEVAEQTLTLKPGNLWGGIDPARGPDITVYQNLCLWYDRTLVPRRGHDVRHCKWRFDGQIWWHL